jgi:hypothetical protein
MKISARSTELLTRVQRRDETVDGLLYTDQPLTTFEREVLVTWGCTFLGSTRWTVSRIRFDARSINTIVNLGFVQGVEIFER